jgi:hypothetical protein
LHDRACQFLLKGIAKQLVAVLAQEDKQLGTADARHGGLVSFG